MLSPVTGKPLSSRARWRSRAPSVTLAVALDGHHVGAGHHDLADDGVAELDDRLDELALLVLDHLVLGGRVGDAEQLLLRHERALLQALAGQEHVGQADERPGDEPQGREARPGRPSGRR